MNDNNIEEDKENWSEPPKNVYGFKDICPSCGGTGIVRPSGRFYDAQACPECDMTGKKKAKE